MSCVKKAMVKAPKNTIHMVGNAIFKKSVRLEETFIIL